MGQSQHCNTIKLTTFCSVLSQFVGTFDSKTLFILPNINRATYPKVHLGLEVLLRFR